MSSRVKHGRLSFDGVVALAYNIMQAPERLNALVAAAEYRATPLL